MRCALSAAGEGSTEPNLYLRLLAQMQTSLATRTKSPESACAESGLFCLYGARLEQSNATVLWTVAHTRLDGHDTFVAAHSRAATQTSPFRRTISLRNHRYNDSIGSFSLIIEIRICL